MPMRRSMSLWMLQIQAAGTVQKSWNCMFPKSSRRKLSNKPLRQLKAFDKVFFKGRRDKDSGFKGEGQRYILLELFA